MKHKHHIIPRHAGGTDEPSNLIELTVEEHAEAHRILFEQYGKWQDKTAWMALSNQIGKEEIIKEIQRNANLGKKRSNESKEKMAAAKRGKKITPEHLKALNEGRRNSKNSEEHIAVLKTIWKGEKHSEETKEKMSLAKKGKPSNNPKGSIDICKKNAESQKGKTWYKDFVTGKRVWVL